jgi:hypothetical protein
MKVKKKLIKKLKALCIDELKKRRRQLDENEGNK